MVPRLKTEHWRTIGPLSLVRRLLRFRRFGGRIVTGSMLAAQAPCVLSTLNFLPEDHNRRAGPGAQTIILSMRGPAGHNARERRGMTGYNL